jgi:Fe-Mn family superoxide dismutase
VPTRLEDKHPAFSRRGDGDTNGIFLEGGPMPYQVPALPYPYDALEAAIDEQTMRLHHDKHHQAYVDNANKALDGTDWADRPVEEVLARIDEIRPDERRLLFRNHGGGHANHSLFWESMSPEGGGEPEGPFRDALDDAFGDLSGFKERFAQAATGLFGSGWAWLVWDGKTLQIEQTPNQDSPLMRGLEPLLGLDVWEHAYYLRYQNRRPEYVKAWWDVVHWHEVGRRFERASTQQGVVARIKSALAG